MENIEQHIEADKKILDDPQISPQARRHTDANPSAPECLVYDD